MDCPSINRLEEISRECETLDRTIETDNEVLTTLIDNKEDPQKINETYVQLREHCKQREQLENEFKETFPSAEKEVYTIGREVFNKDTYAIFLFFYQNYKEECTSLLKAIKWAKGCILSTDFEQSSK